MKNLKKIGLFGGTFDPIHKAHIYIAKKAKEEYSLDEVFFIPSATPPHKVKTTAYNHRYEMLNIAIKDMKDFTILDIESKRSGKSYTVDTLKELTAIYKDSEFYFIMGADSLYEIETWYKPDEILQLTNILVASRYYKKEVLKLDKYVGYLKDKYNASIYIVDCENIDISSTDLRNEFYTNKDIRKYIDDDVISYIKDNNLYKRTLSFVEIKDKLKQELKPQRYEHTIGVADTCACLAMRYDFDIDRAYLAGLLHDCAKNYNNDTLFKLCEKSGIILTEDEFNAPQVLHSIYAPILAKEKYGVDDEEVLSALYYHTTGKADMSILEKIVYVADYIEPNRKKIKDLDYIRNLSFLDLDKATYTITKNTISYLKQSNKYIHKSSVECYNWFRERRDYE